jgi:hypothetical protein
LGFCTKKRKEIIVVCSENQYKQGNAQGKTQNEERRRNECNLESAAKNELEDEKKDHRKNGNNHPIGDKKKKC